MLHRGHTRPAHGWRAPVCPPDPRAPQVGPEKLRTGESRRAEKTRERGHAHVCPAVRCASDLIGCLQCPQPLTTRRPTTASLPNSPLPCLKKKKEKKRVMRNYGQNGGPGGTYLHWTVQRSSGRGKVGQGGRQDRQKPPSHIIANQNWCTVERRRGGGAKRGGKKKKKERRHFGSGHQP
ncbi:hypothetical protein MPH_05365 [Macrophomina phaseolina MS6]|uniref:Uncharacterized protein n=1 Tax=Macrophomina phaseolina (strain MS6) TaxID=1126212 RepID=K2S4G2_MACPH|nr:hypothetical protein MPH_05365 [Macrophomina phaseolina MS6]